MAPPFSSPFHRNHLLRTKEYAAGPLFQLSSLAFTKKGRGHILSDIIPGPIDPDGPAPPDATIIAIGTVSPALLQTNTQGQLEHSLQRKIQQKHPRRKIHLHDQHTRSSTSKIQDKISKSGVNKWFIVQDGSEEAIRFSFHVFESKTATTQNGNLSYFKLLPGLTRIPPDRTLDLRSWIVPRESQESLEEIYDTHVIREFRVFDTDKTRVKPRDIPSKLAGALVECSFTVEHNSFPKDDSFSGIIHQVVILRPAPSKTPSPFKSSTPYRPPAMTTDAIHAQQQIAVNAFTTPLPTQGPSNLQLNGTYKNTSFFNHPT
ncbi:hypothetical protein B0H11DRAFT_1920435 [Mycena galericulata]|nr:hypothetical protein B0H11DRAFT_1920435 [Mycena galericulata]